MKRKRTIPNIVCNIRIILLIGLFFVLPLSCMAFSRDSIGVQPADTLLIEEEPFIIFIVEDPPPEFPGGMSELLKFLNKVIKYPPAAQKAGIEGEVICRFTVNTDGNPVDIKITKSNSKILSKEVLRVMELMPKWKPGRHRGPPQRVHFEIPFVFQLTYEPQ